MRDVTDPDNPVRPSGRALQRYREMRDFQRSAERPYIHLVDGGVSDNIGVRGVLEALQEMAASAAFRGQVGFGQIRRVVVIVVNAHSSPDTDWDRRRQLAVARARLAGASEAEAEAAVPKVNLEVVDVSFDALQDPEEQDYLMNLPTSFVLPEEGVDRLRQAAGQVLRQSKNFAAVLEVMGGASQAP